MVRIVSRQPFLPFSLSALKTFLRVTQDDEDDYLLQLMKNGRAFVELMTSEAVTEATYEEYFDWNGTEYINPKILNVSSITGVSFLDADGAWNDMVEVPFEIYPGSDPIKFRMISTEEEDNDADFWAFLTDPTDAPNLKITYKAGAATSADVTEHFIDIIYNYCGFFYENRQAAATPKFLFDHVGMNRKKYDI